jgi:hypothetical protein
MGAQPRFWKLFAYSTVPVIAALGIGLWLADRIHGGSGIGEQQIRTEEVIAQDRLLVDAVWSAIETIKAHALSLARVRQVQGAAGAQASALPEGTILHWAELEMREGKLVGVRQSARNPAFQPPVSWEAFEGFYLQAAISRMSLSELEQNGVTLLRIKQDPSRNQEWLALAFPASSGAQANVVLALVDPAEVFPIFRRWTSRSESGNLRGYLVGSDGFVLAHSQRPYVASDFSGTQVFQQGVREMLRGQQVSGAGVFKAIDQLPVTVAYARPGTLPLGAVVERVNGKEDAVLASSPLALIRAPGSLLRALTGVFALSLLSALFMRRLTRRVPAVRVEKSLAPQPQPAPQPELPIVRTDLLETQLLEDLLSAKAGEVEARERHAHNVLLARFEDEGQRASEAGDARKMAQQVADHARQLAGSPSLFFGYHPKIRAAVLEAHSGFEGERSPEGMSFRLTDGILARISRYQKEGRTASLSDDPNLCLQLAKRLGHSRCEAWPLMGNGGQLLGVLAVLGRPRGDEAISALLKMTGTLYESLNDARKT